ncbi:pilus assembly protein PapD [Serratia sp. S1B]|nr:pilus assembly protein PapD [Serratia sp. S1B]
MTFPSCNIRQWCGLAVVALFSTNTLASVVISGTRVIYPSDAKEVSVKLNNAGPSPVLVQSWIDKGDANAKPSAIQVPFVLTPPMNRVDPSKGQTLRISYTGEALPVDKESVFWLNVLEVPAKNSAKMAENRLQMAFRSRIKLFYRPVGLSGNASDAAKTLTWSAQGNRIQASNSSPYHVSLVSLTLNGKKIEGQMIAPRGTATFNLSGQPGNTLSGNFVDDYGAINKFESIIH